MARLKTGRIRASVVAAAAAGVAIVGCSSASGGTSASETSLAAASSEVAVPNVDLATSGTHGRWVMGYYVLYQQSMLPPSQIAWGDMTHIAVGAVVPHSDGSLDTSFYSDPSSSPRIAKQIATAAKAHHVVPILMVGGAGTHDDFMSAIEKHQSTLVSNLVGEMKKLNFSGLDLDLEPINQPDEAPFLKFVSALHSADPGIVLSVPVGWTSTNFPTVDSFYGELAQHVDRIDVMSYGMADPSWGSDWRTWFSSALTGAGPHWPTAIDVSVASYRAAGVPAGKLSIGISFAGSCWSGPSHGPRESVSGETITAGDNVMTYPNIMANYYSSSAYHYDTKAQSSYLSFSAPHGQSKCTFLSYEDARSVAAKGAFAKSKGLGGVIIWTINQGHMPSGSTRDSLLAATAKAFS